jgi:GSH-dependent disulfide-bond oxidoreductase
MADLSGFPITTRWPATRPDVIQLYTAPTPNGQKISIALEEVGLPYEAHFIDIWQNETFTPEFVTLNPNGKIPAIIDPDGPGGKSYGLFESGAILVYLADKTGKLMPRDPALRYETLAWMFFQAAHVGPFFGNLGYFYKYAGTAIEDKRPMERFANETKRLLRVIETRLEGRRWIMGEEFTAADITMLGWVNGTIKWYEAGPVVGWDELRHVPAWLERGLARPSVERGMTVPERPA